MLMKMSRRGAFIDACVSFGVISWNKVRRTAESEKSTKLMILERYTLRFTVTGGGDDTTIPVIQHTPPCHHRSSKGKTSLFRVKYQTQDLVLLRHLLRIWKGEEVLTMPCSAR